MQYKYEYRVVILILSEVCVKILMFINYRALQVIRVIQAWP